MADLSWTVAGIGDFDGDAKVDILWRNTSTGENYIYFMDGTTIKATEGFIRTVADQNWQVAGIGDFDGDGKDDILWRHAVTGQNYLYPMDGLAIKPTEGYLRSVADLNWKVVGVADFDGDGKSDILWRNSSSGQNYIYPMNGTSIKATEGFIRTVADMNWQVKGVGDFDGDGKADIVWGNSSSGENYLYPMDGTTIKATEGYLRTVADLAWQIAAVGDYDGDGKADILWRNTSTGENYIYFMDGTAIKPTEGYIRTVADQNWAVMIRPAGQSDACSLRPDNPDNTYADSNCDGIDGDIAKSFFVALSGSDANPGTMAAPFRTIQTAINAAAEHGAKKHVLVGRGNYLESVTLADGVSLFGQYDAAGGWSRSASNTTSITSSETVAVSVANYLGTGAIEGFTISSGNAAAPGTSSRVIVLEQAGSGLSIRHNSIVVGDGASGVAGSHGTAGAAGGNGSPGQFGCDGCTGGGFGGSGGSSACSAGGGAGGRGGWGGEYGQNGQPSPGGMSGGEGGSASVCLDYSYAYPGVDAPFLGGSGLNGGVPSASNQQRGMLSGTQWLALGGFGGGTGSPGRGDGTGDRSAPSPTATRPSSSWCETSMSGAPPAPSACPTACRHTARAMAAAPDARTERKFMARFFQRRWQREGLWRGWGLIWWGAWCGA